MITSVARHWAAQGWNIQILLLDDCPNRFFDSEQFLPVTTIDMQLGRSPFKRVPLLGNLLGARKAIKALKPHTIASFLPGPNILSVLARVGLPVRLVISERNNIAKRPLPLPWRLLRQLTYRFADRVTYNFLGNQTALEKFVPKNKLQYLPNPLWPSSQSFNSGTESKSILSVGRLDFQKGYDALLPAFADSAAPKRGWSLTIVGNGHQRTFLSQRIAQLGISDQVKLVPPTINVWSDFQGSEFFILPSRYEGMPNVLLEALQHGLTPLVSDMVGDLVEPIRCINPRLVHASSNKASIIDQLNWATDPCFSEKPISPVEIEKLLAPYRFENSLPIWCEIFLPD